MPKINKKRLSPGWITALILLLLVDLGLLIRKLIYGKNTALFNPKGLIAHEQHSVMMFTLMVLLAATIPTLILFFFIAWRYRESNVEVAPVPHARRNKSLVVSMWLIPTVIMFVLASVMFPATHKLAPQKSIASDTKPLRIQVISLRWKWLFLYPEQKIASVNFVQIPVNTPVSFEMTADETPMSSFWIPNLGGQLYTMTSHTNRLNLMAETAGDYPGSSAEINGAGFAGMKFTARASSSQDFARWVQSVKQSPDVLDEAEYVSLLAPSEYDPAAFYSAYKSDIYDAVLSKYEGPGGHQH